MRSRTPFVSALVAFLSLAGFSAAQSLTAATPHARIVGDIDDRQTVALRGNVHPLAAAGSSTALASYTRLDHLVLTLNSDASQDAELDQLIKQQADPHSPLYHHFLTPQQFGSQFGVAAADLAKVSGWLESQGFSIDEVSPNGKAIVFSGTAGQVEQTFKTEMRSVLVAGVHHTANTTDPQIPAALSGIVGGIVKLHDFRYTPAISKITTVAANALSAPQMDVNGSHYLAPADYGVIYNINPLYSAGVTGAGQSIAILARSNIAAGDITGFRSYFGLPANNPQIIIANSDPGVVADDTVETTLDTEWSGTVAPNAAVKVVVASSSATTDGIDLSALYAVNNNVAPVISLSYGSCESAMGSAELNFYNSLWKQAAAQGITVLVSAGDSGASCGAARGVNGLCSSPYSTCVGGTEFVDTANPGQYWHPGNNANYGSAISYIPEQVWNESGANGGSGTWAGGGGASIFFAKPAWQTGPGVPADGVRDVPDVALTASGHDGYLIIQGNNLMAVGGTSAAAPSFAGLMALVNQKCGARQGLANPVLYPLAANQAAGGAAVFHDTAAGNNSVPGVTGFAATAGYDLASGLGSVDASALANNWTSGVANSLSLSATPNPVAVNAGKTVGITITSTPSGGFQSAVTLAVAGAPAGLTAALASTTIASPGAGSVTLMVTASSTLKAGTYPLTITAKGGNQSAQVVVSVTVAAPAVTLSASASTISAAPGKPAQVTLTATPQDGFTGTLALYVSGLPAGVTAVFSPASLNAASPASSTLTFALAATTKAGSYPLTITATGSGITVTCSLTLTVAGSKNFALSLSTSSLTVQGGSAPVPFTITISQFSSGFNSPISLAFAGLPAAMRPVLLGENSANGTVNVVIGLSAAAATPVGVYPVTISASGGGVVQSGNLQVTVAGGAQAKR